MATHVAFLRAINLGANRKFPKDLIVEATQAAGFAGVATYINTGNVRIETRMRARQRIEEALEASYREHAGFEVPVIAFTAAEVRAIRDDAAALGHDGPHYVSLLKVEPDAAALAGLEGAGERAPGERLHVSGRAVHVLLRENYRQARLTNTALERHAGVSTNRNLTVVRAVAERWCD